MQSYGTHCFPDGAVCCQDPQGLGAGGCSPAGSARVRWSLHSKAGNCCRHPPKSLVKGEGHVLANARLIPTVIPISAHPGRRMGGREHLAVPTSCSSTKCPRLVPKIGCTPPCPAQGSHAGSMLLLGSPWSCSPASRGATGANSPAPAHPAQCLAPSWWL